MPERSDDACPITRGAPSALRLRGGLVRDDASLAFAFNAEQSSKKRYAVSISGGLCRRDYILGIWKTLVPTPACTEGCGEFCLHRFILMLPQDIGN